MRETKTGKTPRRVLTTVELPEATGQCSVLLEHLPRVQFFLLLKVVYLLIYIYTGAK